ncbi:MAG: recombinase family protein [Sulfurospirillaceae bacterium]|jgi:DNA invertase Pin-like site-specific DNA recombinase|nr:recombinase family protein [Sulfurospirillaceae bacterium]MDD2825390.1 recombinase family protein [Sulfurospirillaceae bacterium]
MIIVLLKNKIDDPTITVQQKHILKYAHQQSLIINTTEIENSDPSLELEERKEFKGFLRSLEEKDCIIIYDLFTFSDKVEELVKVLECLLARSITVHLANSNTIIDTQTKPLALLEILSKQREIVKNLALEKIQGRPKGRMSKSKFDIYRPQIIELLESGKSVSTIATHLNVSRTSLKDYINSRGLKDLVKAKLSLLKSHKKEITLKKDGTPKECSLIKDVVSITEGTTNAL